MRLRLDQNGFHFFDRRSGTNVLFDEHQTPETKWASAPRFVSVALTNVCDLSCSFCYAPKNQFRLSKQQVLSWATELESHQCLGIGFGGGEPTVHPDFAEICQLISSSCELAVSMTTHGHRLTEELVSEVAGAVNFIRLSMDGVGAVYEQIRGRPFNAFTKKAKLAKTACPIGINFVVNCQTVGQLEEAKQFCLSMEVVQLLLLPQRKTIGASSASSDTIQRMNDWIAQDDGAMTIAVAESAEFSSFTVAQPFPRDDCLTGYAHIDARGIVKQRSYGEDGVCIAECENSIVDAIDQLRANGRN